MLGRRHPLGRAVEIEVSAPALTDDALDELVETLEYLDCELVDAGNRRGRLRAVVVAGSPGHAQAYLVERVAAVLLHLGIPNPEIRLAGRDR